MNLLKPERNQVIEVFIIKSELHCAGMDDWVTRGPVCAFAGRKVGADVTQLLCFWDGIKVQG